MSHPLTFWQLRRLTYAVVLMVIGVIIWVKRRRRRARMWADEDDSHDSGVEDSASG